MPIYGIKPSLPAPPPPTRGSRRSLRGFPVGSALSGRVRIVPFEFGSARLFTCFGSALSGAVRFRPDHSGFGSRFGPTTSALSGPSSAPNSNPNPDTAVSNPASALSASSRSGSAPVRLFPAALGSPRPPLRVRIPTGGGRERGGGVARRGRGQEGGGVARRGVTSWWSGGRGGVNSWGPHPTPPPPKPQFGLFRAVLVSLAVAMPTAQIFGCRGYRGGNGGGGGRKEGPPHPNRSFRAPGGRSFAEGAGPPHGSAPGGGGEGK